jgi:hypothetical protein
MKCLSVRQPWAWCITHLPGAAAKDLENRPRNLHYRGPLLIHASLTLSRDDYETALEAALEAGCARSDLPSFGLLERMRGGIVGAVRMVDVSAPGYEPDDRPSSPWRDPDSFAYHLSDRIALPLRPYKGQLGLFNVEPTPAEVAALRPLWPLSP